MTREEMIRDLGHALSAVNAAWSFCEGMHSVQEDLDLARFDLENIIMDLKDGGPA